MRVSFLFVFLSLAPSLLEAEEVIKRKRPEIQIKARVVHQKKRNICEIITIKNSPP